MFEPTPANLLTVFRILLVPVLVVALLSEISIGDELAAAVFIVASADQALMLAKGSGAFDPPRPHG